MLSCGIIKDLVICGRSIYRNRDRGLYRNKNNYTEEDLKSRISILNEYIDRDVYSNNNNDDDNNDEIVIEPKENDGEEKQEDITTEQHHQLLCCIIQKDRY